MRRRVRTGLKCCATSIPLRGGFISSPDRQGQANPAVEMLYLAQRPTRGRIRLFGRN